MYRLSLYLLQICHLRPTLTRWRRRQATTTLIGLRAALPAIVVTLGGQAVLADEVTAETALQKLTETLAWRDRVAMRVVGEVKWEDSEHITNNNVKYSNVRLWRVDSELQSQGFDEVRTPSGDLLPNSRLRIDHMLASNESMSDETLNPMSPEVHLRRDLATRLRELEFLPPLGGMLDGYTFGSNSTSLAQLLAQCDDLRILDHAATVNDVSCVLLAGACRYGEIRAWLAPSYDYLALQYDIAKGPSDRFDAAVLSDLGANGRKTVRWRLGLREAKVESIDDSYLVAGGLIRCTLTDQSGIERTILFSFSRDDIQLGRTPPLYDAAGDLIPNGADIVDYDTPHLAFEWDDGTISPRVDESAASSIDVVLEQYLANSATAAPLLDGGTRHSLLTSNIYCGAYCLYAASVIAGRTVALDELIRPEYIGSSGGSSIGELAAAGRDHGLNVHAQRLNNHSGLKAIGGPALLHVRAGPDSTGPDHFIVYIDSSPRGIRVFEPPTDFRAACIRTISPGQLATRWRGAVLRVSADPIDTGVSKRAAVLGAARVCFAALASLLVLLWVRHSRACKPAKRFRSAGIRGSLWQAGGILLITIPIGVAAHRFSSTGFLHSDSTLAYVKRSATLKHDALVSIEDLPELMAQQQCVLIDARSPAEYAREHIEGAINIPLGTPLSDRLRPLSGFPMTSTLVTYCEPKGCPLAPRLARVLMDDGFVNARALDGDWRQHLAVTLPESRQ